MISETVKTHQQKAIEKHKTEEAILIHQMRQNGGKISGIKARENIDIIRRLWAGNKIASTGEDYTWVLLK